MNLPTNFWLIEGYNTSVEATYDENFGKYTLAYDNGGFNFVTKQELIQLIDSGILSIAKDS